MIGQLHLKGTLDDQEHLIFLVMLMRCKCSLKLCQFHGLTVKFPNHPGIPVIANLLKTP